MDDMTINTKTVIEVRWTLKEIEDIIMGSYEDKSNKTKKSCTEEGKIHDQKFQADDEVIPTVSEKQVKCLGKYFDDTGGYAEHKAWSYKHGVLSRVL
jgi:hypothetical protein